MLSILRVAFATVLVTLIFSSNLSAQCNNGALSNPSFEMGLNDWDVDGDVLLSADASSGTQSIEILGDGNRIYQTISIQEGQTVTLNAEVKKTGSNGDANVGIKFLDGNYALLDFNYATLEDASNFESINEITAVAPVLTAFVEITAFTNAAASSIIVDDFCLQVEGTGTGPKPDLVINNMRGDFFINAGDPFDLTFDLGNIGQQIAIGDLQVGVYISDDDQFDSSDQEMIIENYSNIPIGGTNDLTAVFTSPSTLSPGNHYMIVVVDILDQIAESNESNNQTFRILEIGGLNPDPCAIELSIIDGSIQCNDNNTNDNPSDDLWSFQLLVENTLNPDADGWKSEIAGQDYEGEYGEVQTISGIAIAQGPLSFLVRDRTDNSCEKDFLNLIPPFPCSNVVPPPTCDITINIDQNSIVCDDNGTVSDPTDDTWSLSLVVNNTNAQLEGWKANINGQFLEGDYGDVKTVDGMMISSGTVDITVSDRDDDSCVENVFGIQPPQTCSNVVPPPTCDIIINVDQNSIICDDNGTVSDPTDDTWSFSLVVNNTNAQLEGWKANINGQFLEGDYGDVKTIDGMMISSGAVDLMISDKDDDSCVENVFGIQPPDACSNIVPPSNDKADLTILNIGLNQNLTIGASANTAVNVKNIGLGSATGIFNLDYFISSDEFLSTDDILVNEHTFGNFGPGSAVNIGLSFTIPLNTVEGDYFLIAFIDSKDDVDESNESNNIFVNEISINDVVAPPSGVCDPYSLFPWEDYIGKVKINEEGFSSGKSEYSDFRNIVFDVPLEEPNAIELTSFFSWENYDEYFSVYIDFNQDGDYTSDEIYYQGMIEAKPNGSEKNKLFSGLFTINPPNVVLGLTSMRVMMSREGFAGPCDVLNYGEVEDYSVNVVEELTYNPYETREGQSAEQLFVYPNPANDYLNVNLEEVFQSEGKLLLIDQLGKIVYEENLDEIFEDTYKLLLAEFPSGLYTLYVKPTNKRALHSKVLVVGTE